MHVFSEKVGVRMPFGPGLSIVVVSDQITGQRKSNLWLCRRSDEKPPTSLRIVTGWQIQSFWMDGYETQNGWFIPYHFFCHMRGFINGLRTLKCCFLRGHPQPPPLFLLSLRKARQTWFQISSGRVLLRCLALADLDIQMFPLNPAHRPEDVQMVDLPTT